MCIFFTRGRVYYFYKLWMWMWWYPYKDNLIWNYELWGMCCQWRYGIFYTMCVTSKSPWNIFTRGFERSVYIYVFKYRLGESVRGISRTMIMWYGCVPIVITSVWRLYLCDMWKMRKEIKGLRARCEKQNIRWRNAKTYGGEMPKHTVAECQTIYMRSVLLGFVPNRGDLFYLFTYAINNYVSYWFEYC